MLEYSFGDGFEVTVEKKQEKQNGRQKFLLIVKQFHYGVQQKHWKMSFSEEVRDAFYKEHLEKDYIAKQYL